MILSNITFADIQTSNLLYYDEKIDKDCLQFCRDRDIDCLPALDDSLKFYRKMDTGFCEDSVTPRRKALGGEFIFNETLLERFQENHLLFVYTSEELTGVVHFSDYNRPEVNLFLFNLLSSYEKSMRKLLIACRLENKDMLDYFRKKVKTTKNDKTKSIYNTKINNFGKDPSRDKNLPAFEKFYLRDLMELSSDRKIIKVDQRVNDLRNNVMHAQDFVNMVDANSDDYIYDFNSFETFFTRVKVLLQDFKRVNNRVAFYEITGKCYEGI
jgi:hypothetical protein